MANQKLDERWKLQEQCSEREESYWLTDNDGESLRNITLEFTINKMRNASYPQCSERVIRHLSGNM